MYLTTFLIVLFYKNGINIRKSFAESRSLWIPVLMFHGVNSLTMFILSVNSDKVTKQLQSHELSFNNLCRLSECIRPLQIFTDKLVVFMN